jgi:arylsulfatase A
MSFWATYGYTPRPPFSPTPLPLLNGTTIIEQPVALDTLVSRYVGVASEFIHRHAASQKPFFLYMSFNHVHAPNSCSPPFCGKSKRGAVGDAVEEMDWSVGQIMGALKDAGVDNNTIVFFTSDNGAPLSNDQFGNLPLRDGKSSTW